MAYTQYDSGSALDLALSRKIFQVVLPSRYVIDRHAVRVISTGQTT